MVQQWFTWQTHGLEASQGAATLLQAAEMGDTHTLLGGQDQPGSTMPPRRGWDRPAYRTLIDMYIIVHTCTQSLGMIEAENFDVRMCSMMIHDVKAGTQDCFKWLCDPAISSPRLRQELQLRPQLREACNSRGHEPATMWGDVST